MADFGEKRRRNHLTVLNAFLGREAGCITCENVLGDVFQRESTVASTARESLSQQPLHVIPASSPILQQGGFPHRRRNHLTEVNAFSTVTCRDHLTVLNAFWVLMGWRVTCANVRALCFSPSVDGHRTEHYNTGTVSQDYLLASRNEGQPILLDLHRGCQDCQSMRDPELDARHSAIDPA
jgi:hypothetical protein